MNIALLFQLAPHIRDNWRFAIIGILLGVIIYQNFSTKPYWDIDTIPLIKAEIVIANDKLETAVDGNKALVADIEARNTEITEWKTITADLEQAAIILTETIKVEKTRHDNRVAGILNRKTARSCEEAFDDLNHGIEELKTW